MRYSPQTAAPILGISERQIRRLCDAMGIHPRIEARGPVYEISEAQMEKMKQRPRVGRPKEKKSA